MIKVWNDERSRRRTSILVARVSQRSKALRGDNVWQAAWENDVGMMYWTGEAVWEQQLEVRGALSAQPWQLPCNLKAGRKKREESLIMKGGGHEIRDGESEQCVRCGLQTARSDSVCQYVQYVHASCSCSGPCSFDMLLLCLMCVCVCRSLCVCVMRWD